MAYDDAGVVALRTIGPILIELPFTPAPGTTPWAASIWPAGDGWGRQLWLYDTVTRGWTIPPSCTHGTIVELGTAIAPTRRQPARTHTAWYAVAIAHDLHWLICTSPFTTPAEAAVHARHVTDHHRRHIVERYRTDTRSQPEPTT
jgi:hypothetical protein